MSRARLLGVAGITAWLMVGLPVVIQGGASTGVMAGWATAFSLFGALFLADLRRPRLLYLALESLAVLVIVLLLCDGFEGALMVLIAMRLPALLDRRRGLLWILVQTLLLTAAVSIHWNLRAALLIAPPWFGFQILAFLTFELLDREMQANAQLRAMHDLVADGGRMAERLRIGRELHDALGHHLTALTLNLEAAFVRSAGDVRSDVQKAQSLARTLLTDVRTIVAEKHEGDAVDLARALRTLVADIPRPQIHLEVEEALGIEDPERAGVIVRCVQEVVTNAARHSGAENLWIVVRRRGDGALEIRARDDGRGVRTSPDGFGLRSMRARIEGAGGALTIDGAGPGFSLTALVPSRIGTP